MQHYRRTPQLNNRERKRALWIFLFKSIFKFGHCYWCERRLKFESSTFDHNPPISHPNSHPDRGVISCEACNHSRVNLRLGYPPTPNYLKAMEEDKKLEQRQRIKNEESINRAWERNFHV